MRFGQRYKAWRTERGISNYRISEMTGIKRPNLTQIEKGDYLPSDEVLQKLAAVAELGLSCETLQVWRTLDAVPADMVRQCAALVDPATAPPYRGRVAAGRLATEDPELADRRVNWGPIKHYTDEMFCLQVSGLSMYPPVPDGAILLVRPARELTENGWYVVEAEDGERTFKIFRRDPDTGAGVLHPFNEDFAPIVLDEDNSYRIFDVLGFKTDWEFV